MDHARRLFGGLMLTSLLMGVALPTAAAGSPSPPPLDDPRIPHDVPALEALFPGSVDGRPLFKLSMGRPSLALMGDASLGDFDALVAELGVERTDLELAFANDPTASPPFNYLAIRVAGVTGATLVETYERLIPLTEVDATAQRIEVAGREVVWVAIPYNPIPNIWFWSEGDTLIGIQAAAEPSFQELYQLLPDPAPAKSPSLSAAEPTGTPTIRNIWDFAPLSPILPGTYFIDPDLDPSTPLRVVYEVPVEGWSMWVGAVKFADDGGHVGVRSPP